MLRIQDVLDGLDAKADRIGDRLGEQLGGAAVFIGESFEACTERLRAAVLAAIAGLALVAALAVSALLVALHSRPA